MKNAFLKLSFFLLIVACLLSNSKAQTVLFNYNFQTTTLPAGVTSDGVISPTKTADPPCTQGAIQVNSPAGYFQVVATSCNVFSLNMKSTGGSARSVTVKYKKDGDAGFTTLSPALSVQAAATFNLTTLYPVLVTSVGITVRLEPTNGNIQIHDLYVTGNDVASNAAEITAFSLPVQTGSSVINSAAGTIAINVPSGTDVSNTVPQTVTLSPGATISPLATAARNFSSPVSYTVTAQDGTTTKAWTVTVTQVASSAKEITAFKLSNQQIGSAVINSAAGTIAVNMPNTESLTNLVPVTLTLSANATVNPLSTAAQNFSSPVVYTVTAQDNSTKTWTVNVTQVDPNTVFTTYEAEEAIFTGVVESANTGFTGSGYINFLAGGDNEIIFTVCQQTAGTRTAKFVYALANDERRTGSLFVNDVFIDTLTFPRGAAFTEYKEKIININLLQGLNNIKVKWDTTDGPNFDKLLLGGAVCPSYTLTTSATNGGTVTVSPARTNHKYFDVEQVTLSAQSTPSVLFNNWSGDLTGNTTPATISMNANKTIVGNFSVVPTYTLNVITEGLGNVTLSPAGGTYAQGTVVTLTASPVLGSTFAGWQQDASGTNTTTTVTMNANKTVKAIFNSSYTFNFENVIGFASMPGDGFTGPTTGGQNATDTLVINGPSEFNKLCEGLYNRQQAYKNNTVVGGMKKAKLVILLKAGIYDGTQSLSANGAKVFGNYMMDIPEQGDLTLIGQSGVVFKVGINVKRSYNIIIRNIFFQDYYDDGINIGYPETHHIWIDHCTIGHPVALPADTEHPDGGCDIKDGASYVTVSWCLFRNSWKTSLAGHSDNNGATDNGRLKVTYANNYFLGTNSRNPRVRFGQVHVLNNLMENVGLYGSVAANSAQIVAENNFYLNTDWPMYADRTVADFKTVFGNNTDNVYTSKTGNYPASGLKQMGNEYDDRGLPVITAQINPAMLNPGGRSIKFDELNPGSVFIPSSYYTYTPLSASVVRVVVPIYAGADKVTFPVNNYYYSKATGDLNALSTWGANPDGTGTSPVSFTANNQVFNIRNNTSHTIAADWTVGGSNSQVLVGNGTNPDTLHVAASKVFTINNSAGLMVQTNASLVFNAGSNFIVGTGSVADFNNKTVTLKSNATGTASIGTVRGTVSNATNVTVERYISDKRAWRLLGIPFSASAQTIKASWMEGGTSAANNPNPGFGTHITTFTGDGNAANFDGQKPSSSIRKYLTNTFTADAAHTPNTADLITEIPASFLFVRGNRSIDLNSATAHSATTLRITGTLNTGPVTKGVTGTSFSLIPNPYPASIDFDSVKKAYPSINKFYVWDANLTGPNGVGQYRTIDITGTAPAYTYTATPVGEANANWRFIESGTAFFVPGSTTLNFTEAMKSSGTPPTSMLRVTPGNRTELLVNLYTINADNTTSLADGVREVFDNNYSATVDYDDAKKIAGFNLNLGISSNSEILAIEKRPLPNANDVILLHLSGMAQGNYLFQLQPANFPGSSLPAFLKDNYLGTTTAIDLTGDTKVNFSITSDMASSAANRFSIVFTKTAFSPGKSLITVYPNPVQNGVVTLLMNNMPKGIYQVRLLNALGQTILTRQINHAEGSSTETFSVNKVKGVYTLQVVKPDNSKQNNKVIIN